MATYKRRCQVVGESEIVLARRYTADSTYGYGLAETEQSRQEVGVGRNRKTAQNYLERCVANDVDSRVLVSLESSGLQACFFIDVNHACTTFPHCYREFAAIESSET